VRAYAYSQHINMIKHRIIEKLIKLIESRLSEMEEGDAMILTQAYQYIDADVPYSTRLWNKLNQSIAE
jgi:xanthine dehydrogenase iron-sulfur cluster and FAD-binding subunit A